MNKKITIRGVVQGVGLRYAVLKKAQVIGITGHVKNMDDGTVEIEASGAKRQINSFIKEIQSIKEPAIIRHIDITDKKAIGKFVDFTIKTGDLRTEMMEGFGVGHSYFERLIEKQDQMIEKQDQMIEKQDQTITVIHGMVKNQEKMIEKQDQTITVIHGMAEKQEKMIEKQDQTIMEIRGLSRNIHDLMDERFQRMEKDVRAIKEKIGLS